jgi:DNA-binding MarR family transcriptional regulator
MDVAIIGFLKADGHRQRILEMLGRKPGATARQISHKLRMGRPQTDATIKELIEKGLLKKEKEGHSLTPEGEKVLTQVKRAGM